ncbi:hypothetical protein CLU79DRAFT_526758 [Phycomyces nitens]|nr:hypothetical protein CLU79DRAFT_526758 [Phycomyces nitens]
MINLTRRTNICGNSLTRAPLPRVSGQPLANNSNKRNSAPSKRKRTKEVEDEGESERRQNLLERNRQAALKCRQRKKEWIAQLQANDIQSAAENSALRRQIAIYREEILNLKTMLVAHAHCPLSTSQNTPGNSVLDMICTTPNPAGNHYR